MGFFSFLSRKSHDKGGKSNNFLKSQNYSSTPSGALPVQGPYPAPGNGPNLLETLTRSRPEFSQTHVSLNAHHVAAAAGAAPSPAVPRFRDERVERPSTAPNGSNPNATWANAGTRLKKQTSRGAPPVSFRMFKRDPSVQEARPVSRRAEAIAPKISVGHSRSNSIRSEGERGFKDILDAQSEIKPADFKTRLQATGARDYGEDVADRNLGQNGFNLEAPHVQAFYAQSTSTLRRAESSDPLTRPYGTGIRTQSLTSSSQFPVLNKTAPEGALYFARSSPALNATRRQSLNTYMPPTSSKDERCYSMDRFIHLYPSGKRRDSHHAIPVPLPPPEPQGLTKRPLSPRPSTATPILVNNPLVTKQGPFRPPLLPRDSLLLAKKKSAADGTVSDHVPDEANCNGPRKERSFSLRPSLYTPRSLSASASVASPRKRHSLHSLQLSVASRETHPSTSTSKQDEQAEMPLVIPTLAVQGAASISETIKPKPTIENSSPSLSSPEPSPEPSTSHDAQATPTQEPSPDQTSTNASPPKTRSLRAWSASSATATISDTSSNPFQSPQSRHTTNTSVDLSNASASLKASSRTSLHSPPVVTVPTSPKTPKPPKSTSNFNIDDYVSSDDDSIVGSSRRPGAESEEDLLFNPSGYGTDSQLPGLFDSLTSASRQSSQAPLQRHRSSPSFSPNERPMVYTGDSFGRAAGRRYILDTGAVDDESDEFYSGEEDDYDDGDSMFSVGAGIRSPPLLKPSRVINRVGARPRSSHFYHGQRYYYEGEKNTTHGIIEEEREGKVDVKAAVRLRKEVKARKRAAVAARGGGGIGKNRDLKGVQVGVREVGLGVEEEEEGNRADVE